jgi:hypothetical protein
MEEIQVATYTTKPRTTEAIEWTGTNLREVSAFLSGAESNFYMSHTAADSGLVLKMAGGEHIVRTGDYIIRSIDGEFYPCPPGVFKASCEKVDADGARPGTSDLVALRS